jgi:tetratricopeptide (TPR) repeat protein
MEGADSEQTELATACGKLSVELSPVAISYNGLGTALYRNGQFSEAVEALEKADSMIVGGDREHRMILAMALWQMGNEDQALRCYNEVIEWQEQQENLPEEQARSRHMAERLMEISIDASPPTPSPIGGINQG